MARLVRGRTGDVNVGMMSASEDEQLTFAVLGSLHVERGGTVVDCGGLKQRAVLALLVVNANRPLSPDRMVYELWGDEPPPTAVATLQAYISNIRKALEPGRPPRAPSAILVSRAGTYELVVDPECVDVLRFERLVAEGQKLLAAEPTRARTVLAEAVAMWRGATLVEFVDYDFAAIEIARLDELHAGATEALIEADLACGRGAELVADLERLVAVHPLRERLWSQLMRAYYRAGRQADSLRAFRRCQQLLVEELGIEPSPELRALEQAILLQDQTLSVSLSGGDAAPATLVDPRDHIIGRDDELARFRRAVDRAKTGHGSVLLIDGDPGVGKTRLLEAMGQQAVDLGCRVALARCVEVGGSPPFWPWIQIVRALGVEAVADAATGDGRFLLALEPSGPETDIISLGRQRYQIADGLVGAMRRLGVNGPVVTLIDDGYCADPDSLSVLSLIGAAIADVPMVVVATHRSNSPGSNHTLTDVLVQLARLDWCERFRLGPLDRRSVEELVHRIGGSDVDDAAVNAIVDRSEGNAFFTVELARLILIGGGADPGFGLIPDTVREVVARRLDALDPGAVALLRAAALIGRTFDLMVVAEAVDLTPAEALELADSAAAEGIIDEAEPGEYRFSHLLVIEAIVAALGSFRRAQLHSRIAAALEDRYLGDQARWHEIAHHRTEAVPVTGPGHAIDALARAGRHATAVNALAAADQLLNRRHQLVMADRPSPDRDEAELESLLDLSVIWTWRDGYQSDEMRRAADRMLQLTQTTRAEAAPDHSTGTGLCPRLLQALQARCSYEIVAGNITASADTAETMLRMAELNPHPYVLAVAHINAEVAALHHGRIADAIAHSDIVNGLLADVDPGESGEITLPLGQQSLTVTHLGFTGWIQRMSGDPPTACRTLARARAVADRRGHAFTRAFHATIESVVAAIDGSPEWVEDVLAWERTTDRADRYGFVDSALGLYRQWAAGIGDDPVGAADAVRGMIIELDRGGASVVRTLQWGLVAELQLLAGRSTDALVAVKAGLNHAERFDERFWQPELRRLMASALGAVGDATGQADALARAEREACELGMGAFKRRSLI